MATKKLSLTLEIDSTPQRVMKNGKQEVIEVLEVARNDAGVLYDVLSAIDTAKPDYRKMRRSISRLRREIKPFRNLAESILSVGKHDIGAIELSVSQAEQIKKLIEEPPDDFRFFGASSDTLVELETELEKLIEDGEDDEEPEIIDTPPVK